MIYEAIIRILLFPIKFIIGFLPAGEMPSQVIGAINLIAPKFADAMIMFPFLGTAKTIFFIILSVEVSISVFAGLNWIYNKLRGSG